ncbi:MAG: sn-glycerol-3-phosphate transporter ATP-binding protein UgpC [Planctomycetota bacterium]|jgi:multiple sugar transport system ATP-binding protein
MATVKLTKVGKVYEGPQGSAVRAVEEVDLAIADGEFCVLVGPSGCGKSTTLRMIAGLEEISEGVLEIDGRKVNDVPAKDRDIAFVFQNYALYPHLTVAENIAFGLETRRTHRSALVAAVSGASGARADESARIRERVAEVSRTLGLDPLLARYPRELSGGQRQRVAVGRAIARDPKVFLFDEPLSNLDARLRIETRTELRMLHRRLAATIVYVTHDQEEAMTLADRLVVMHKGRVQQNASAQECYERPANRFVAGFIGTPPMNIVDGRAEAGVFTANGVGLPVAPSIGACPCAAGFRPDRVRLTAPNSTGSVAATVAAVERLGDRTDIALDSVWGRVIARLDADLAAHVREGDAVGFTFEATHAHFFEPGECGKRMN